MRKYVCILHQYLIQDLCKNYKNESNLFKVRNNYENCLRNLRTTKFRNILLISICLSEVEGNIYTTAADSVTKFLYIQLLFSLTCSYC